MADRDLSGVMSMYKHGTTSWEMAEAEIRPKMMALHSGIHMGLLRERGISPTTVVMVVLTMGLSRSAAPRAADSLTERPALLCVFILSIITMASLTTIPTSEMMPIMAGKEKGIQARKNPPKVPIMAKGRDSIMIKGCVKEPN